MEEEGIDMRITSKGQVTIPADIREAAGLLPNTEVEFQYDGETVRIVRSTSTNKLNRGDQLITRLKGRDENRMTTEEIMALTRGD